MSSVRLIFERQLQGDPRAKMAIDAGQEAKVNDDPAGMAITLFR